MFVVVVDTGGGGFVVDGDATPCVSILPLNVCEFMLTFVLIIVMFGVKTGPAGEVPYLGQSLNLGYSIIFSHAYVKLIKIKTLKSVLCRKPFYF